MKIRNFILMAAIAIAARADDGKTIVNRDGSCQVSVPSTWTAGGLPGIAESADKKVSIAISSPKVDSFATLKVNARNIYANDKVTKDTATEFEMQGTGLSRKPNVYRGVAAGNKVCVGEVTYASGTADDALKILGTLKPK
jgi:hypothetical protein